MAWLRPRPEMIPAALRTLDQWVLWRAEARGDPESKPTKVPYRIAEPSRRASSTDPTSWGTFEDAVGAYAALADVGAVPIVGIGLALTREAGITCLDLDRVLAGETLNPVAGELLARHPSWTEISPSGTGLHLFVRGTVPAAITGEQIEVYSDARYIAITGHHWPGTPEAVLDHQPWLSALARLQNAVRPARRSWTGPSAPPPDDLAGALLAQLSRWGVPVGRLKHWQDGYLVDLVACPWAHEHSGGDPGGACVIIHPSGARDFRCLHAHCGRRSWRDFRAVMEPSR